MTENVIEFQKDSTIASATITQGRYKTRIRKLAELHPEECQIIAENDDGSMYAKIPVAWIRINPGLMLTKEQRTARAEQLRRNVYGNGADQCDDG